MKNRKIDKFQQKHFVWKCLNCIKLTDCTRNLINDKGYVACYILAGRCIPVFLIACFICYAIWRVLFEIAPLQQFPFQVFIFPAFAGLFAFLIFIRIIFYLLLAIWLKG